MKKHIITILFLILTTNLFSQNFTSVSAIKEYLIKNITQLDPIEGIWSVSQTIPKENWPGAVNDLVYIDVFQCAIIKKEDYFVVYRIEKDNSVSFDKLNRFNKTASKSIFIWECRTNKIPDIDNYIRKNHVYLEGDKLLKASLFDHSKLVRKDSYLKIFPDDNTINDAQYKDKKTTGTGFAISSNGYIVTCNHVIENAKILKVRGINGDFSKTYTVKVVASDFNNDLALLKIDDASFTRLGSIPYIIKSMSTDVGISIYTLGYPLTATMGDEIKLTVGIVSAKSGFKGDITSYQVSSAVQPGNSGGPLFDNNGKIIGIVNAKHVLAENATYAVKSSYLMNMIESLQSKPTLQTVNTLSGKNLTSQVKLIKDFVFIIEVN